MKPRRKPLGTQNVLGASIAAIRKSQGLSQREVVSRLQTLGFDINPSSYSKIEGQTRCLTDYEISAIAKALGSSPQRLFDGLPT